MEAFWSVLFLLLKFVPFIWLGYSAFFAVTLNCHRGFINMQCFAQISCEGTIVVVFLKHANLIFYEIWKLYLISCRCATNFCCSPVNRFAVSWASWSRRHSCICEFQISLIFQTYASCQRVGNSALYTRLLYRQFNVLM